MTWTASLLPDDALPPDSLVGTMLRPELVSDPYKLKPLAMVEPLPLWRVMQDAYDEAPWQPPEGVTDKDDWIDRYGNAAEIEALRDWLLPEEPEPHPAQPFIDEIQAQWEERQRLRAQLTEQARIAREGQ